MELLDLHLGRPVHRRALSVFPVWTGAAVVTRGYDLRGDHVRVAERAGAAVAEELVVTNAGPRPALLLAGELLEGGQQHRIAARSVLVGSGEAVVLDVRCVEEGRWSGSADHIRRGRRAPGSVRAADDQSGVWQSVRRHEERSGAGPTHSILDATASVAERAERLIAGLRPLPFQCGVLIGVAGQPLLLEAFDSPRTLSHAWETLLTAAASDAVDAAALPTPGRRARRFLDRATAVPLDSREAGIASGLAGRSDKARLELLIWHGRAVHTVAANLRHELIAA